MSLESQKAKAHSEHEIQEVHKPEAKLDANEDKHATNEDKQFEIGEKQVANEEMQSHQKDIMHK